MKYIINQSRLDGLVMNFLDEKFKGIEENVDAVGGGIYEWWGFGNYQMIEKYLSSDGKISVGINSTMWKSIKGMFGLTATQTDEYFKKWVRLNLGLDPYEIYQF